MSKMLVLRTHFLDRPDVSLKVQELSSTTVNIEVGT